MRIKARNLTVCAGRVPIISGLSVSATDGDSIAIIGPSGSGKTTFLNALGGLARIQNGQLHIDDTDATPWKDRQWRSFWRSSASFILQDYGLIEDENVAANVQMKRRLFGKTIADKKAQEALQSVGLADRATSPVITLSGGEKRRVSIARSIYKNSTVIYADEPTASLDRNSRLNVQELLLQEAARKKIVFIATHDLELAQACTKIVEIPAKKL